MDDGLRFGVLDKTRGSEEAEITEQILKSGWRPPREIGRVTTTSRGPCFNHALSTRATQHATAFQARAASSWASGDVISSMCQKIAAVAAVAAVAAWQAAHCSRSAPMLGPRPRSVPIHPIIFRDCGLVAIVLRGVQFEPSATSAPGSTRAAGALIGSRISAVEPTFASHQVGRRETAWNPARRGWGCFSLGLDKLNDISTSQRASALFSCPERSHIAAKEALDTTRFFIPPFGSHKQTRAGGWIRQDPK